MMPFSDGPNTAVFTTRFVMKEKKDITYVAHDAEDGAWQFMSDDNVNDIYKVAMVVGLGEIVKHDPSLLELSDLPLGWCAMREKKGGEWTREVMK